jgi:kinesin family protein 18/19
LKGYNGCVFAYGATGTGKTYTMLGGVNQPGLCNLTLKDIFAKINSPEFSEDRYEIKVCYIEIYNEAIRDLLVPKDNANYLDLRDDPIKGVMIAGANEVEVSDTEEIINLLHQGNRRRTTEATNANQTSSRSHAVFQVIVYSSPKSKNINFEKRCGKLSLIDLAGSERGTVTENRGIRLREGAKINQSLLALANCINALGDKNKKGSFVPYRDSKLTRLLKDSLGGNCKTVMIVTVSPSATQFDETVNTLKYANRAKNIKTKPIENKKLVELHIAEYKSIISDLRSEVDHLKKKLRTGAESVEGSQGNDARSQCICGSQNDEVEVKKIQEELFENFQERIQLRRGLCELDAQNQLNVMEIKRGQKELMRLTLSASGQLVERKDNQGRTDLTSKLAF